MNQQLLLTIMLTFLSVNVTRGMDAVPVPMEIDEEKKPLLDKYELQPHSVLLLLPDELLQLILRYVATPTFIKEDWKHGFRLSGCFFECKYDDIDPQKLERDIKEKLDYPIKEIKKARDACACTCKRLALIFPVTLKNYLSWIKQQYTVEGVAQALKDALAKYKMSLSDICDSCGSSLCWAVQDNYLDVSRVLLLAADSPRNYIFVKEAFGKTAFHHAGIHCRDKALIIMMLKASGNRVTELCNMIDDGFGGNRIALSAITLAQINNNQIFLETVSNFLQKFKEDTSETLCQCIIL